MLSRSAVTSYPTEDPGIRCLGKFWPPVSACAVSISLTGPTAYTSGNDRLGPAPGLPVFVDYGVKIAVTLVGAPGGAITGGGAGTVTTATFDGKPTRPAVSVTTTVKPWSPTTGSTVTLVAALGMVATGTAGVVDAMSKTETLAISVIGMAVPSERTVGKVQLMVSVLTVKLLWW